MIYNYQKVKNSCTFIDYSKMFDTINIPVLWSKLINHNINGRVLNVIYNMYTKAKFCIKINDSCMSDFLKCNEGVRDSLAIVISNFSE